MLEPEDLYGLALDRFTPERNALARELRAAGRRDEAATVAKLRKPSVAAWAVNQLVRTQRRDVEALFTAGDALQRAQADLLAKRGDASSLRQALDAEREAVVGLVRKASGLLDSDGHELNPARLEQVTDTLHAAALEEDARAMVRDGCLERELRHVGLGSLAAPGRAASRSRQSRQQRAASQKAAREAEASARRRVERAKRQERTAEQRRERAAGELSSAEAALTAAREAVAAAEAELARAREALEQP